jgi:preprotein translocase subunit SecY
MLGSLVQAFKIPDVRKRILFTAGMFSIYVLGVHISLPGLDTAAMGRLFHAGGFLGDLLDAFSGGALRRYSIFALGVMPYINATIIFQLIAMVSPRIEELQKEGDYGRKIIGRWTRILTVALAVLQAAGFSLGIRAVGGKMPPVPVWLMAVISMAAGTAFLMWVGEQISDKGIGNGVSMVIFCGIMIYLPSELGNTLNLWRTGAHSPFQLMLLTAIMGVLLVGIIGVQQAHRKIPIQYTKRVVGNRVYGGAESFLPLRVNHAGVIPIIFAISIIMLPEMILRAVPPTAADSAATAIRNTLHLRVAEDKFAAQVDNALQTLQNTFDPASGWYGALVYFITVVLFTYFYTAVTFKPAETADDLRKWGGTVPGIRPGRQTAEYLDRVMVRITLFGALFLGIIALGPYWVPKITGVHTFSLVGGTSLLIVVGVALETMQQLEAHLLMRQYEGFVK